MSSTCILIDTPALYNSTANAHLRCMSASVAM